MRTSPHNYLQSKWYVNTRWEIDGYTGRVIYSLPYDVAGIVQSVLWLDVVPDIAAVKNGKVVDNSSAITKLCPEIPLVYSLFFLEWSKKKIIASPIMWERIIHPWQDYHHRSLAVNIMSSQNDFETIGWLYISTKKRDMFQKQQAWNL